MTLILQYRAVGLLYKEMNDVEFDTSPPKNCRLQKNTDPSSKYYKLWYLNNGCNLYHDTGYRLWP